MTTTNITIVTNGSKIITTTIITNGSQVITNEIFDYTSSDWTLGGVVWLALNLLIIVFVVYTIFRICRWVWRMKPKSNEKPPANASH